MHRSPTRALLGCLAAALVGCGGSTHPGAAPPSVQVMGRAFEGDPFVMVPDASSTTSPSNGTDFGEWSMGTLGQPLDPLQRSFELRNTGTSPVGLATPGLEVQGPDRALFPVVEPSPNSLSPGASATFRVAFTGGGGLGPHRATVVVHLQGRDYSFQVAGMSVLPVAH